MNERTGPWTQTASGIKFYPFDPRPEDVRLADIAHALSNICRFGGAVRQFYSVAQHSVLVARNVPSEFAAWGLLHDAAEAYIGDIPRPIKYGLRDSPIIDIECDINKAIRQKFSLPEWSEDCWYDVDVVDDRMLATEARDLMAPLHPDWRIDAAPFDFPITPVPPPMARAEFLEEARKLGLRD